MLSTGVLAISPRATVLPQPGGVTALTHSIERQARPNNHYPVGDRLVVAVGASRRWRLSKPKPRRAIGPARHNRVKVSKRPIVVVYETEVLQQPPQLDGPNFHSPHHTLNYASRTASPTLFGRSGCRAGPPIARGGANAPVADAVMAITGLQSGGIGTSHKPNGNR